MTNTLRLVSDRRGEDTTRPEEAELRFSETPRRRGRTARAAARATARAKELLRDEQGAVTAEYAVVIMAAVAFAGLLVAIMRSREIRAMLVQLVENALAAGG